VVNIKNLKDLRKSFGLYQRDLAIKIGVTQAAVSDWENGRRIPRLKMLNKIASFFGISVDYLVEL